MITTWKLPSSKVYHDLNNALGICVHEKHYKVLPTQMVPISALVRGLIPCIFPSLSSWLFTNQSAGSNLRYYDPLAYGEAKRKPTQIARSMGPTWGPPGSCRPQMGPILAPWTLLWGIYICRETCIYIYHPFTDSLPVAVRQSEGPA